MRVARSKRWWRRRTRMLLLFTCLSFPLSLVLPFVPFPTQPIHPPRSSSLSASRSNYTIVINTWRRSYLLKQAVAHYAACPSLDSIHVVWSELDPPKGSLYHELIRAMNSNPRCYEGVHLKFELNQENSMNNRFKEIKDLKTDAVFSVDDDVLISCPSLELAFNIWRLAPTTMVGFVPRMHWLAKMKPSAEKYSYGGWWSVWWTGTYSIVLSKAAFFHRQYLDLYTNNMFASIRDYVTQTRNCEDIAMAFLIANVTNVPPIWVKGRVREIAASGISSLKGHNAQRTQCLNYFASIYGRMPLISTTVKAIDGRRSWIW